MQVIPRAEVFGGPTPGAALNFDQYDPDHTLRLEYGDDDAQRQVGLTVVDRPELPLGELLDRLDAIDALPEETERIAARDAVVVAAQGRQRVFVGKDQQHEARLTLSDPAGNPPTHARRGC